MNSPVSIQVCGSCACPAVMTCRLSCLLTPWFPWFDQCDLENNLTPFIKWKFFFCTDVFNEVVILFIISVILYKTWTWVTDTQTPEKGGRLASRFLHSKCSPSVKSNRRKVVDLSGLANKKITPVICIVLD